MANPAESAISRRKLLKAAACGLAGMGIASLLPATALGQVAPVARPPNIIFILADDLGIADVRCSGGDHFATPNIDALAKSGTRFEYCYATPLSGPSRCQALTGRYPFRTGLNSNQSQNAVSPEREIMMPTIMKRAGYATALVGKWGQICLGPGEWGFQEYLTFPGSGHYWNNQNNGAARRYTVNGKQKELANGEYLPDVMHQFLVDYIQRHKDEPFYVHYSMSHIHGPILRTPDSKPGQDGPAALYADNVAYMDKLVGQLVTALDRMKLRERTLIIFTGDNGTARFGLDAATIDGRHIFGHKGQLNEGGCRVPLIANWPGTTPAGVLNHDLTDFSDFFPTFAELGGAQMPPKLAIDGRSFAAQIKGQKGTPRQWVYAELNGHCFVRDAGYKLTDSGELLDMREAPFDEVSVPVGSKDPAALAARTRLEAVLKEHQPAPGHDTQNTPPALPPRRRPARNRAI